MIETPLTPVRAFEENQDLLAFRGLIGRRWYAIHKASALLMLILPILLASAIVVWPANTAPNPSASAGLLMIGAILLIALATIAFVVISIGLSIRRLRDILGQDPLPGWAWLLIGFEWLSGAHLVTFWILMLVPGALARQAEAARPPADLATQ